jgi:hypothetical protein
MVGLRQQLIWLVDARGLTEKEFKLVGLLTRVVVKSQLFHFPHFQFIFNQSEF